MIAHDHEAINGTMSPTRYEEVTRMFADVSVVYPDMLAQFSSSDGYFAELGTLDDSRIAQLVRKGIEYRERFATGSLDELFDVHTSPHLPKSIAIRYLARAKTEQYKLIAISTLLENGVLHESALKQALEQVQGDEFLEEAFHGAVGIITDYAHEGKLDPRAGGTGLGQL